MDKFLIKQEYLEESKVPDGNPWGTLKHQHFHFIFRFNELVSIAAKSR